MACYDRPTGHQHRYIEVNIDECINTQLYAMQRKTENSLSGFFLTVLAGIVAGLIVYAYQDEVKAIIGLRRNELSSRQDSLRYYQKLVTEIEELKRKKVRDDEAITKLTNELQKLKVEMSKSRETQAVTPQITVNNVDSTKGVVRKKLSKAEREAIGKRIGERVAARLAEQQKMKEDSLKKAQ